MIGEDRAAELSTRGAIGRDGGWRIYEDQGVKVRRIHEALR